MQLHVKEFASFVDLVRWLSVVIDQIIVLNVEHMPVYRLTYQSNPVSKVSSTASPACRSD